MGAYFHSYQQTASSILALYSGELPFAIFLKKHFKQHKKYGSRDRKIIADLCFGYLRIGQSALAYSIHDQLIIGYYLTHQHDMGYLELFKPELLDSLELSLQSKISLITKVYPEFALQNIFAFQSSLSDEVDREIFSLHHIKRPSFFIRNRPGKTMKVVSALNKTQVKYSLLSSDSVRIEKDIDIETVLSVNTDCVVQDHSSQRSFDLLNHIQFPKQISIWDACAGSGGKSIMAHDLFPDSSLYVSDIRQEILQELVHRFNMAGIKPQKVFCTDLQHSLSSQVAISNLPEMGVDLIVADVPCTGSGTWGRSPEWLRSFEESVVENYHQRQTSIVSRLPHHLKKGGYLLYITCSVFRRENEDVVEFILQNTKLQLIKQEAILGDLSESDYLFAALFILKA